MNLNTPFDLPVIRRRPTPASLLYTYLSNPNPKEIQGALKLYQQETQGFPGEMTQDDLNKYVDIVRTRREYPHGNLP